MQSQPEFFLYDGMTGRDMPVFAEDPRLNAPNLYRPSRALQNAVNVAIQLGKPLLLTGEPGSGKTQLAHNISWTFKQQGPLVFNTRTSSKATDLFYQYDALGHLQYTQNPHNKALSPDEVESRFIRYQALGEAIRSKQRQVVLIDEIDKAPRDLPNDILNILEELAFDVTEVNKTYRADAGSRPVIIMTSNSEKNLPDAFLRRCIFQHLSFPGEKQLFDIVANKIGSEVYGATDLQSVIIPHFMMIRQLLKRKKPGTAELLLWVSLLSKLRLPSSYIQQYQQLGPNEKSQLLMSYNVLAKTEEDLSLLRQILGNTPPATAV